MIGTKRISWVGSKLPAMMKGAAAERAPTAAREEATHRLLEATGIPTIAEATTPEEEAIELLRIAAGVEHALMVQYLYAAFSFRDARHDSFARTIRTIAEQEMAHFATVQNLLRALGAEPFLGRRNDGPPSELDPLPFHLEPASRVALAKYVALEMPSLDLVAPELRPEVEAIVAEANDAVPGDVRRVGAIYLKIYWLFQEGDGPEGPLALTPAMGMPAGWHIRALRPRDEVMPYQTTAAEWRGSVPNFYVDPVGDRADAFKALHRIMAQGEGLLDDDDSHFHAFLEGYRSFVAAPPGILPVPTNPSLSTEPHADAEREQNRITHPLARLWAELFDIRYHMLLIILGLSLSTPTSDPARETYVNWSLEEMKTGIARVSQHISQLPRKEGGAPDGDRAAPAWSAPGVLPSGRNEGLQRLRELTARSERLLARLAEVDQSLGVRSLIANLRRLDSARREGPSLLSVLPVA
ncbi:ferritin-like domain-containing protein [Polyangium sorediatum]|uniref:Ferritin-like domain-containing protein n=1 Tax=Polyangium sorediatum TaxID=889274 RepID=A0ABT6NSU8_9BACT|nr:ferritin-like domain-containing protein [Polyangium sorediatum]MDI1431392.1 ferritin-like domain-containing protein [Polyangium sorediatum]